MVRCIQSIFGSTDFFRIQTHQLKFGKRHLFLDRLIWPSLYLGEFIFGSVVDAFNLNLERILR